MLPRVFKGLLNYKIHAKSFKWVMHPKIPEFYCVISRYLFFVANLLRNDIPGFLSIQLTWVSTVHDNKISYLIN